MEPVTTAALIGGGSQIVGAATNAYAQGKMNKKTRAWNEKMYAKQQSDSLANWHLQNSYNSPEAQMARLQKAGLNPNLVYGNGTVANSTSAPDTPHAMPYKPEAPNFNIPQVVDGYFDTQSKAQLMSNQKQQGDLLALDALIKSQDLKEKMLNNNFLESYGINNRKDKETTTNNLLFEQFFEKQMRNLFMTEGASNPMFHKGGGYDLQQKGAELTNHLRRLEMQGKGYRNQSDKTTSQFKKRTMSGEFDDMSAKDILQLMIQGAGLYK